MKNLPLIAVDVGNARIKLGLFDAAIDASRVGRAQRSPTKTMSGSISVGASLRSTHPTSGKSIFGVIPEPVRTLPLVGDSPDLNGIAPWLGDAASGRHDWRIASVNRPAATRLIDWLRENRPDERITLLASGDLPLCVRLDRPDMVGIDRLVDAVAVNRLRDDGRAAVIVDVGSAITVDFVDADGAFCGGAILPGLQMSARALHEFTDLLPLLNMSELTAPPPALGTETTPAMESGLFWGTVGAVRELIEQFQKLATGGRIEPQVFLTGGGAEGVAPLLGRDARYVPHLTLAGIALAASFEER